MSRIIKSNSVRFLLEDTIAIDVPFADSFFRTPKNNQKVNSFDEDFKNQQSSYENLINEGKREAERIIEEAKIQKENIIQEGLASKDEMMKTWEKTAYEEGYEKGFKKGEEEASQLKLEAESLVVNAKKEYEEILKTCEPDMIHLVLSTIEKLLHKAIILNPSIVEFLIKSALAEGKISGKVFIRVSEDDFDTIQSKKEELLSFLDSTTNLDIIKDPHLEKGGCLIESDLGLLDIGLMTQFEGLKENMYYLLGELK